MNNFKTPAPFSESTGNLAGEWFRFKKDFAIYLEATDLINTATSRRLVNILLNFMESDAKGTYDTFQFANDEEKYNLASVLLKFDELYLPTKNVLLDRYKFFTHRQGDESFDMYLTELKKRVKFCEFKDLEDELLMTAMATGLKDAEIREDLLREVNLTLESACAFVRSRIVGKNRLHNNAESEMGSSTTDNHALITSSIGIGQRQNRNAQNAGVNQSSNSLKSNPNNSENCLLSLENDDGKDWLKSLSIQVHGASQSNANDSKVDLLGISTDFTEEVEDDDVVEIFDETGGRDPVFRYDSLKDEFVAASNQTNPAQEVSASSSNQMEASFNCNECASSFRQKAQMIQHLTIHSGEKSKQRRVNSQIESGKKIYQCHVCNHQFQDCYRFRSHRRTCGRGIAKRKCKICDRLFRTTFGLKGHMRQIHSALMTHTVVDGEKRHQCTLCKRNFSSKRALKIHLKTIHKGAVLCETCGICFKTKYALAGHSKRHLSRNMNPFVRL